VDAFYCTKTVEILTCPKDEEGRNLPFMFALYIEDAFSAHVRYKVT